MGRSRRCEVRVDDHRGPGGSVEQSNLVLDGEVVEESEAQDQVEAAQIDRADVLSDPGDPVVPGEARVPSVHCRHVPAGVRRA